MKTVAEFLERVYDGEIDLIQGGIDRVVFRENDDYVIKMDKSDMEYDELEALSDYFCDSMDECYIESDDTFSSSCASGDQNSNEMDLYENLVELAQESSFDILRNIPKMEYIDDNGTLIRAEYCGVTLKYVCSEDDELRRRFRNDDIGDLLEEYESKYGELHRALRPTTVLLAVDANLTTLEEINNLSQTLEVISEKHYLGNDFHWDNIAYKNNIPYLIDLGFAG